MIGRGWGVAKIEVEAGSYGSVQHLESDYHRIIDD